MRKLLTHTALTLACKSLLLLFLVGSSMFVKGAEVPGGVNHTAELETLRKELKANPRDTTKVPRVIEILTEDSWRLSEDALAELVGYTICAVSYVREPKTRTKYTEKLRQGCHYWGFRHLNIALMEGYVAFLEQQGENETPLYAIIELGNIYYKAHAYDEAAKHYERARQEGVRSDNKPGIRIALNNLGLVDEEKEDWSQAIDRHLHALAISRSLKMTDELVYDYFRLGQCYNAIESPDLAIKYLDSGFKKNQISLGGYTHAHAYGEMILAWGDKGNIKQANKWYSDGMAKMRENHWDQYENISQLDFCLSKAQLQVGLVEEARQTFERLDRDKMLQSGIDAWIVPYFNLGMEIASKQGRPKDVFRLAQEEEKILAGRWTEELNIGLRTNRVLLEVQRFQQQYELQTKQEEKQAKLESESRVRRIVLRGLGLLSVSITIALLLWVGWMRQARKKELQSKLELEERNELLKLQRAEERKLRKEAEEQAKEKARFLSQLSHEVRTPMQGVLGISTLMKTEPLNKTQREYVEEIEYAGSSLLILVDEILGLEGKKAISRPQYLASESIRKILFRAKRLVEGGGGVEITLKIPALDGEISVPSHQELVVERGVLVQCCIVHALELMASLHQGKELEMRMEREEIIRGKSKWSLTIESKNSELREVTDNETLRNKKWIIGQLVGRMGWVMEVGECDIVFSRIMAEKEVYAVTDEPGQGAKKYEALKGIEILYAEDNTMNQKLVRMLFERAGSHVHIARNGVEAVEMLQANRYDLVILDIQMPLKGGEEVAQELKKSTGWPTAATVKIIGLTADVFLQDNEQVLKHFDKVLFKPIDNEDLLKVATTSQLHHS